MKRRSFFKRGTSALLSASVSMVTLLGGLPFGNADITAKAAVSADKTIKINAADVSTFNDTDGDGLGEFQGFGTSLCWWANRIGYSDELTEQAATYFFDEDEGLGLNIGRYNVGGGDNTYDPKDNGTVVEVPRNKKAKILTSDRAVIPFSGKKMSAEENGKFGNAKYSTSDADFGFAKGQKVGKFNAIGWINGLNDAPGDGGNLVFNFNAPETGDYTVKMLFTLTGDNDRGVSLQVDRDSVKTETVEVNPESNEAEAEAAETSVVIAEDDSTKEDAAQNSTEESSNVVEAETDEIKADDEEAVVSNQDDADIAEDENKASDNQETTTADDDKAVENEDKSVPDVVIPENSQDDDKAENDESTEASKDSETAEDAEDISSESVALENKVLDSDEAQKVTERYDVSAADINSDIVATTNNAKLYRVTISNVKLTEGTNKFTIGGNGGWTLDFVKLLVVKSGEEGVVPEGANDYVEDIDTTSIPDTPFAHEDHIVRSDSAVPGYCVDVTKIDDDTNPDNFDRYDKECGFAWNYNWDADKNQINVLKAAIAKAGADEFIAEAFSNSPPYFMTVSGCSSGNVDANKDNLRSDSVNAFATYMADVVEHWYNEGILFQSATPMNEPYTNYWGKSSDKQEGCHFDLGESQSRIITAFAKKLEEKGLANVVLSASDETSIDTAIASYKALSDEAKQVVTRIDTHTYSGNDRKGLRKLAEESGENLWMSEVDGAFTVKGAGEMSSSLGFSERLIKDLNGLMPSAWIIWDIIDTHISDKADVAANETASKYPEAYNKYDNSDSLEEWLENNNENEGKSLWGVAIADHSNQNVVLTKKYYAFGQYTRYIRPGYTLMGSDNETVAAYDSKGHKLVIVATNKDSADKTWKFDLSGFAGIGENVTAIRTSGSLASGENWADVSDVVNAAVSKEDKNFTATVKGRSITTFIIDGVSYDKDIANADPESRAFTASEVAANDYVLYLVDCGSTDTEEVPEGYKLGLYQSVTDKEFGTDEGTGLKWGHAAADENSIMVQKGSTNGSITDTCYYMSDKINFDQEKSGFDYSFELPEVLSDKYEVTVGFQVPSGWGTKKVDIDIEGQSVAKQLKVNDTSVTEKKYKVEVTDGELNVFVHNSKAESRSDDPIISYILVKADWRQEMIDPANESRRILHLTFDKDVNDSSKSSAKVTAYRENNVTEDVTITKDDKQVGSGAIQFNRDDKLWLDVKDSNGGNLLKGLNEITINYFSKAADNGSTNWAFYAAPDRNSQNYGNDKYLGIIDEKNNNGLDVERYFNGRTNGTAYYQLSSPDWKMVTVSANAEETKVYVNGKKVAELDAQGKNLVDIFGEEAGVLQIGRANWGSGEYSQLVMDDLSIFSGAFTPEEVAALYENLKPEVVEEEPETDLGIRVTSVEPNYTDRLEVALGEDYSLVENTGAKLTFNNDTTKDYAVIAWYDKDGNRVTNTKDFKAGTYKLTGKLSYFGNPVAIQKADPYVIYNEADGYYYMTSSWPAYNDADHGYDRVALRRSKTLAGLSEAEDVTVWKAHESGELSHHIWAPELHKIGDDWYVYFAGTSDNGVWNIRPYVLHCTDSNDLLNPEKWEEKGRFVNKDGKYDGAFDAFSLDMTMFEAGGKSYVIWAYKTKTSDLKMAELNTEEPWKLATDPITLSTPEYSWEMNGNEKINEGPAVLKKDGKIYVAFSGSTTGPEYCMGLLTAEENSNLMDPASWTKNKKPVLQTDDLVGQYGPGHNSFTVDNKTGEIIVVYHSRDEKCYKDQCEWAKVDPLYDPCRNANMAILRFDSKGNPVFTSTEEVELQNIADADKNFTMTVVVGSSKDQLDADAKALTIPNADDIRGNISLPETGKNGSEITWESSNTKVITDTDNGSIKKGVVTRTDKDEKVTLTATLKKGEESATKSFELTVKAKAAAKDYTHYLFAYFTGEGSANGEQIYFADSKDGLNWSALNMSEPVITSTLGEKGLRDPFIIRSPEGDKFYLIATDLKINGNGDWNKAQRAGSKSIMVWESTDLVNWGEQRMVEVANEDAGCTWAPEAFYDDETGEYIVFWASMIDGYHKIWYTTTRDFYTFSEAKVWIHLTSDSGENLSVIDTSVIAVDNADGTKTYYRLSKDEAGKSITDGDPNAKFTIIEKATSLTGEWTRISSEFLNKNTGVEGGTIFKFNGENKWCMLLDNYGAGGYYPSVTDDLSSGSFRKLEKTEYSFPSTMRHGTVIGITDEEYKAIEKKWGDSDEFEEYETSLAGAAIAHFTFDDEETGFTGNGAKAESHNGYDVVDHDGNNAVKLNRGDKQYLTINKEDGSGLLAGLDQFTVNYWSNTEVKKDTQWLFYAAADESVPVYNGEHYVGITDPLSNDQLLHIERYNCQGSRSTHNTANVNTYSNQWKMVTAVFYENKTKLYVNGELKSVVNSDVKLSDILGENGIVQIGKANWGGGEYSNIMVDEVSLFNRPITKSEISDLYNGKVDFNKTVEEPSGNEDPSEEKKDDEPEVKPETSETKPEVTPEKEPAKVDTTEDKTEADSIPSVSGKIKKIKKGKNKGKYQLVLKDGSVAKGLVKVGNKKYYLGKNGVAKKGFHKVDGKKYYTDKKGKVLTGLRKINGNKYYFDKDGVMQTGKVKIGKKIYYFAKNGKLTKTTKAK